MKRVNQTVMIDCTARIGTGTAWKACKKRRPSDNPYEVWRCGAWTWNVRKYWGDPSKPYARVLCDVSSPHTPGGFDTGDVYVAEIARAGAVLIATGYPTGGEPKRSRPAVQFKVERQWDTRTKAGGFKRMVIRSVKHGDETLYVIPALAAGLGAGFFVAPKRRDTYNPAFFDEATIYRTLAMVRDVLAKGTVTLSFPTPEPKSWRVMVIADNSGKWCGNAVRYPTEQMALNAAADLAMRWTLVVDYRVEPSQDAPNREAK